MPSNTRVLQEGKTLLDICLELHMSNTGASDVLTENDITKYLDILITATLCWEEGLKQWKDFDDAVLNLVKITTRETILRRRQLQKE